MAHSFGGVWTREKLSILQDYLGFYTQALKNQPFNLLYVDAFAGTGKQNPKFDGVQDDFLPEEDFDGSVSVALGVEPGFDRYYFNDLDAEHVHALEQMRNRHPTKDIQISQLDANDFIPSFCSSLTSKDRAVMFLDPYSTELNWETLGHVAESQKIDLWLLFPISAILRVTPTEGARIKPEWSGTISRLLGDNGWEDALYKPKPLPPMDDMFGDDSLADEYSRLNVEELTDWVTKRLEELFSYVANPVRLDNNGKPLFLFYFAVSNPSEKAWRLADRVVSGITKRKGK